MKIEKISTAFVYILLILAIFTFSTVPVYEVEGDNIDDKTLLYSTSGIFHYGNFLEFRELEDVLVNNCKADKICEWRVYEQVNAYHNYLMFSIISGIVNATLENQVPEIQRIPITYSATFLIQHGIFYLLGLLLIIHGGRISRLLPVIFLLGVLLTDKWTMNGTLVYLFDVIPDYLLAFGYTPAIYVSRGVAGIAFMMGCVAFIGNHRRVLAAIIGLLPFLHLGYSLYLLTIFILALVGSKVIERNKDYLNIVIAGVALSFSLLMNLTTLLPMLGNTASRIDIIVLLGEVIKNIDYKSLSLLVLLAIASFICAQKLRKEFNIVWPLRITIMAFILNIILSVFLSYDASIRILYSDILGNQAIFQLYQRMSGVMAIPAQLLTLAQLFLIFYALVVIVRNSKMQWYARLVIYLLIPLFYYQVSDLNSFYSRTLSHYTYLTNSYESRLETTISRPSRIPYDLEMGLKKDRYSSYSFDEIKAIGLENIDPNNQVAFSLAIYYFLTGK